MKCNQCEIPALYLIGEAKTPLCLKCYSTHEQMTQKRIKENMKLLKYYDDAIAFHLGYGPPPSIGSTTSTGDITMNNIHIANSNIGIVNTGEIYAQNIQPHIQILAKNEPNLANILENLSKSLIECKDISQTEKNDILELISSIAEESIKPPTQRRKRLVLTALEGIGRTVSMINGLIQIWGPFSHAIKLFFNC